MKNIKSTIFSIISVLFFVEGILFLTPSSGDEKDSIIIFERIAGVLGIVLFIIFLRMAIKYYEERKKLTK